MIGVLILGIGVGLLFGCAVACIASAVTYTRGYEDGTDQSCYDHGFDDGIKFEMEAHKTDDRA